MISFSPGLHVIKSISWRITGSVDTLLWAWFLSGEWTFGLSIGGAEMTTKVVLYYLHDRIWHKTETAGHWSSRKIHVFKTITWRCLGTLDTIVLSWFISGSWQLGLQLGGIEIITKMILYYMHERVWFLVKWKTAHHST
jgi:uncharacterized membrane protein